LEKDLPSFGGFPIAQRGEGKGLIQLGERRDNCEMVEKLGKVCIRSNTHTRGGKKKHKGW